MRRFLSLLPLFVTFLALAGCGGERGARTPSVDYHPPHIESYHEDSGTGTVDPERSPTDTSAVFDGIGFITSNYDPERHMQHVRTLASDSFQGRLTGTRGGEAAADNIESQLTALDLRPWSAAGLHTLRQPFTAGGFSGQNIVAVLPGTGEGFTVLSAHYDHLGTDPDGDVYNGADDNAAGVGAILEAARLFSMMPRAQKTTVFCAFDAEEQGQLGASALGSQIRASGLSGQVEVINIDGIGATGGSYFGVWDEGNPDTEPLVGALRQAADTLGIRLVEEGTDIGSDAQPLDWAFSIPAVTVDWDWGSDPDAYHPYYHTTGDDAGHIDTGSLASAARVAIAGFWLRAESTP
jgi:Zn-dependent M28 family amino/carboxypeptidase